MSELESELESAGGALAPPAATARLRALLAEALRSGREELDRPRSGYGAPVTVALAARSGRLLAATPANASLRADPAAAGERTWLLVAAVVGAMAELAAAQPPRAAADLGLQGGAVAGGFLGLALPAAGVDAQGLEELAGLAFDEHAAGVDRLRARALAVPPAVLEGLPGELRDPIGATHPLRIAEAVARLGGHPARAASVQEHEEQVLALLASGDQGPVRPHEDPDPARRVARRILQRLDGMGKWGGYHTEFAHLSRGFAGNDRALAQEVGEALLHAGLLAQKPSVGQRHVFLNPRRAAEVRRLIDAGEQPADLRLPRP